MKRGVTGCALALLFILSDERTASAQEAGNASLGELLQGKTDISELSLDDLLVHEFDVAAKRPQTLRDSPNVMTVLSREEIAASGARDLLDVLSLVPGFYPAVDANGVFSVGFRGLWSNDGRQLLLVDGQEMNEPFYTNVRLGNRFPVSQIDRIEIIRGPGSAIYGGFAEMAVINVITRGAATQQGVAATSTLGTFDRGRGRRTNVAVSYADKVASLDNLAASIALYAGRANDGLRFYEDSYGDRYRVTDGNGLREPLFANVGLSWRDVELRLIYDGYQKYQRDILDGSAASPYRLEDHGTFAELRYTWKLGDAVKVVPSASFKRQRPWRVPDVNNDAYYMKTADRYLGKLTLFVDPWPELSLLAGVEAYVQQARLDSDELVGFQGTFAGDAMEVEYNDLAAFAQALYASPFGTL
ncbi:MAG: TonB-dependent receptor plug domain-containing protein, partial [Myxococcota bacterium]